MTYTGEFQDIRLRLTDMDAKLDKMRVQLEKLGTTTPPVQTGNISRKLTLPIDKNGNLSGHAAEILPEDLAGYSDEYYFLANGRRVYKVPPTGATTDNASYPRTENRYYYKGTNFKRGQKFSYTRKFKIEEINAKGKGVIFQSHAVEAPPDFKFVIDGSGKLRILCKTKDTSTSDDKIVTVTTAFDFSVEHELAATWDGITLKTWLDGVAAETVNFQKTTDWYFKDGAYNAARYNFALSYPDDSIPFKEI